MPIECDTVETLLASHCNESVLLRCADDVPIDQALDCAHALESSEPACAAALDAAIACARSRLAAFVLTCAVGIALTAAAAFALHCACSGARRARPRAVEAESYFAMDDDREGAQKGSRPGTPEPPPYVDVIRS